MRAVAQTVGRAAAYGDGPGGLGAVLMDEYAPGSHWTEVSPRTRAAEEKLALAVLESAFWDTIRGNDVASEAQWWMLDDCDEDGEPRDAPFTFAWCVMHAGWPPEYSDPVVVRERVRAFLERSKMLHPPEVRAYEAEAWDQRAFVPEDPLVLGEPELPRTQVSDALAAFAAALTVAALANLYREDPLPYYRALSRRIERPFWDAVSLAQLAAVDVLAHDGVEARP